MFLSAFFCNNAEKLQGVLENQERRRHQGWSRLKEDFTDCELRSKEHDQSEQKATQIQVNLLSNSFGPKWKPALLKQVFVLLFKLKLPLPRLHRLYHRAEVSSEAHFSTLKGSLLRLAGIPDSPVVKIRRECSLCLKTAISTSESPDLISGFWSCIRAAYQFCPCIGTVF